MAVMESTETIETVGQARSVHAKRFIKFCLVGASSVIVQLTTLQIVEMVFHSKSDLVVQGGNALGIAFAIINGFIWNRLWTFEHGNTSGTAGQFARFVAVNAVGILFQLTLVHIFYVRLRLFHSFAQGDKIDSLLAIGIVTFWNFYANSRWTFNKK